VAAADPQASRHLARRITLGGMLAALALGAVILAFFSPTADLALYSIASLAVAAAVIELDLRGALAVYIAAGLLSLIYPGLAAAYPLLLFFGPYPILKALIEKRFTRGLAALLKLLAGNVLAAVSALVFAWPLAASLQDKTGSFFWPVLLTGAQVILVLYDYGLSLLIQLYLDRLRRR
jgi:hypothetical protein